MEKLYGKTDWDNLNIYIRDLVIDLKFVAITPPLPDEKSKKVLLIMMWQSSRKRSKTKPIGLVFLMIDLREEYYL